MKRPWEYVDESPVPDDDKVLYLLRRGNHWSIHVDERELMSNREHGSEDALAEFAIERLESPDSARILVGGFGMGFTLAAALRNVGPEARVTVAELSEAIVRWSDEHTGKAAGYPNRDPRSEIFIGDVCELIESPPQPWDAILLDVDNGPQSPTRPGNSWLYTPEGLTACREALTIGGVLGVWSAGPDPTFTARLTEMGFQTEALEFHEPGRPMGTAATQFHYLWMAKRLA